MSIIDRVLATDTVPDSILRFGIRRLLAQRLKAEAHLRKDDPDARETLLQQMRSSPIALQTRAANQQHYEVPTEFYRYCLGPRLKYSSGLWDQATDDLGSAEENMLRLTAQRAQLADGQRILELGCGWGSLTLWMAERFPNAAIVGVSNSKTQKEFIDQRAAESGLRNVRIITADMNDFAPEEAFDRVVSVEMFEHMRNWELLLKRISGWLEPEGKFFLHIFTHRTLTYFFENQDESDWMSRHFFTGGMMPSEGLIHNLSRHLKVEEQWQVSGTHYQKTAEAWLKNMDRHENAILPILADTYGKGEMAKWWGYWRIFFMACAELWGYRCGQEWTVSHYLLERRL
jgi:cyclopropane-fatty-acyl-phospholipid synthase